MKRAISIFAVLLIVVNAVSAATVESVAASQQWPWSIDIKVKYTLSDVTSPVDLKVSAINEGKSLAVPRNAISGDLYGITSQSGSFTIDPAKAFGTARAALTDLQIRIELSDSAGNIDEALYRIYDLNDGSCTDVTRRDLLNGRWGAVETDYKAIDPAFETGLGDVLIWTDVTNNPAYKTDKLVMRKVHAQNAVWRSGDPDEASVSKFSKVARHWVKLTYDYYISVFETTQAQYNKIMGSVPSGCVGDDSGCPVNNIYYHIVHGHPQGGRGVNSGEIVCFPTNSYVRDVENSSTFSAKMWNKTGVEFTLPTFVEWEFACRGGNDSALYSCEPQTIDNVRKLAWTGSDSGDKPGIVGTKLANAYGLYDMLGNVMERTLGSGGANLGAISGSGLTSDDPAINPLGNLVTVKDTNPYTCGGASYTTQNDFGKWQDCRHAAKVAGWYEWWAQRTFIGFRLVCPVTKKWGADWPKTVIGE